ncbi:hypothetical protein SAMN04488057_104396 [Cyclobacterium lianum]|uniref:tRNA (Guanine-N1)-methyltransferase n=1 Tax=Cyclobacterium lianum TaxID=388280 RepID=A0A1M7MPG3_9BACT|nr:hypothetical protein [Cyclobacterium lianum]SHM92412.1 hypothetical protein SAMN04488057_104396 [Cyclobacterium lianum]
MKTKFNYFFFAALLTFNINLIAQVEPEASSSLDSGTIEEQFEYLKSVSSNYQEYKVIRRSQLDKIQSNILDSIGAYQSNIQELRQTLDENNNEIQSLNEKLSATAADYEQAVAERDSFTLFGMLLHKNYYNNLVWGIIILLLLVLLVSFFRFKRSHKITAETQQTLEDLREEFEQHRRNTLERERKLNRQLVDALNNKDS